MQSDSVSPSMGLFIGEYDANEGRGELKVQKTDREFNEKQRFISIHTRASHDIILTGNQRLSHSRLINLTTMHSYVDKYTRRTVVEVV